MSIAQRPPAVADDETPPHDPSAPPSALTTHEPPISEGSYDASVPDANQRLGDRRVDKQPKGFKKFFTVLGPGLITGASDDDPSGVGTYSTAGAATGFRYLWTALLTYPMQAAIQGMCARIGLVSGKGLAATIKQYYPKGVLYPIVLLLIAANTFNVGADLAAIAAGINLLVPIPILALIPPIAVGLILLQVFAKYQAINRIFKWLCIALLAYVATAFVSHANLVEVAKGTFIPKLPRTKDDIGLMIAILGTTISPYLFFWQAGQEIEEQKAEGKTTVAERKGATRQEVANRKLDVNLGMLSLEPRDVLHHPDDGGDAPCQGEDGHQQRGGRRRRTPTIARPCGGDPVRHWHHRRRSARDPGADRFRRLCSLGSIGLAARTG